jgi:hypothetical protein
MPATAPLSAVDLAEKAATTARSLDLCGECAKERALLACNQCHEVYCRGCAVAVHRKGRRTRHERFVELPPCSECDSVYADVHCTKCDEYYCARCAIATHAKGRKATVAHTHVMVSITDGIPTEPPHRNAAAGGRNSFGLAMDELTFARYDNDDGIPHDVADIAAIEAANAAAAAALGNETVAAAPESPIKSPAASVRAKSTGELRKLNVVDGYGQVCGPERAASDTLDAMEAAKLKIPQTNETILVADGAALTPTRELSPSKAVLASASRAALHDSAAAVQPPTARAPLTSAQPLSLEPVPVRVPRSVQQGTTPAAIAQWTASLREAQLTEERARQKVADVLPLLRNWRRRGDGSDPAAAPPTLFTEYKEATWHRPTIAPLYAPPNVGGLSREAQEAASDAQKNREAEVLAAEPVLVPFFEATPLKAEFFLLSVAAVLASNGHHVDSDATDAATAAIAAMPASADDAAAPVETPPLPAAKGEIFAKWFASADQLLQHELLTCRFFVAEHSEWNYRHDQSAFEDITRRLQAAEKADVATVEKLMHERAAAPKPYTVPSHFVTVDTLLPTVDDLRPAFGRTEEKKELWLAMLMKAYAVAHPKNIGVAALHKDSPASVLEVLTGGATSQARWRLDDPAAVGMVWWLLQLCAAFRLPVVMCRRPMPDDDVDESATDGGHSSPLTSAQTRDLDAADPGAAHTNSNNSFAARRASSRPISRTAVSTSPTPTSGANSSLRAVSPGATDAWSCPVTVESDGTVDRFPWVQGDVLLTACEYRFDTGLAETLADMDDPDADAKSTSSAATALTTHSTQGFGMGGAVAGSNELHRLVKLRQLYSTSRGDDDSGWLPSWHDDTNPWSDVMAASPTGGAPRLSRGFSVASTGTSTSAARASGSLNARWTKATRRTLQHPAPDDRVGWMDAATFVSKYNTILFARNLAQHPHHRLHLGVVDRTVRREDAASYYPAYLLQIQKRDTGAGNGTTDNWRTQLELQRDVPVAELLAAADMNKDFGFTVGTVDIETDDEDAAEGDETRSTGSRANTSTTALDLPGASRTTTALVMRVTLSQPCRTAMNQPVARRESMAHRHGLRNSVSTAAIGRTVAPAAPPPPLELQVYRTSTADRVRCVPVLASDGVQVNALPSHSRVHARVISSQTTHDAVEVVYELEANTGCYNIVVAPPAGDEGESGVPPLGVVAMTKQPFAVAIAMVRNAPQYDLRTAAF